MGPWWGEGTGPGQRESRAVAACHGQTHSPLARLPVAPEQVTVPPLLSSPPLLSLSHPSHTQKLVTLGSSSPGL